MEVAALFGGGAWEFTWCEVASSDAPLEMGGNWMIISGERVETAGKNVKRDTRVSE